MEHSLILEAVLQGDGAMAKAEMQLHIERSENWLCDISKNRKKPRSVISPPGPMKREVSRKPRSLRDEFAENSLDRLH